MYFPDYRLRFIRTPKNACSTIMHTLGYRIAKGDSPHDHEAILSADPGGAEEWPIIAVHRDPYSRLVSGYLDKLIAPKWHEKFASDTVAAASASASGPRYPGQHISFREFVNYVCSVSDDMRDMHWRSQEYFLGDTKPDIFLNFENLDAQWKSHSLLKEIPLLRFSPHATGGGIDVHRSLVDVPGNKIEGFREVTARHPSSSCFADEALEERVKSAFEADYALLGRFADAVPPVIESSSEGWRAVLTTAFGWYSRRT